MRITRYVGPGPVPANIVLASTEPPVDLSERLREIPSDVVRLILANLSIDSYRGRSRAGKDKLSLTAARAGDLAACCMLPGLKNLPSDRKGASTQKW